MKYRDTSTIRALLAPLDAEILELSSKRDQLARTIESVKSTNKNLSKTKQRPTKQLENKLKSFDHRLAMAANSIQAYCSDPNLLSWPQALSALVEASDNVWNAKQFLLGKKEREDYEGKFEDSYRDRMGWELGASTAPTDFPDGSEGKYLNGVDATFRSGKAGKRAFGALLRTIAREFPDEAMAEEQWEMLFDGEVSTSKLYRTFPEAVRLKMHAALAPERVLTYPSLVFMTEVGFFVVPQADYPKALHLASVSQMGAKYRLRRDYINARLKRLLTAQDKADVAA